MIMLDRLESIRGNESGFTTAELLGNAALGIVALAGIWFAMTQIGVDVIAEIRKQMHLGGSTSGGTSTAN